jgi:preprotein translocase subunit SecA
MGPLYQFHGISVDCIDKHQPNSEQRRLAYEAGVTFGTNNEFGFDYLRDNMALSPEDLVQRPHNYAIVDEVDSVLIDDARTPLIISGPTPKGENQQFLELKPSVEKLIKAQRELFAKKFNEAKQELAKDPKSGTGGFYLVQANKMLPKNKSLIKFLSESGMKTLMLKTEDIYLSENAKRMPEVTEELYFVIEEKNNSVDLTEKGIELISKDAGDSNFFLMPDIGSVIADIERQETDPARKLLLKDELMADYAIKSERIHTIQQLLRAYALFEKDDEYVVIENKVKIVDEQTGRIMEGRRYSDGLHQAIEAKENVKVEAATQTFATITLQNFFRMYKKLSGMTGTAETEAGELWDIYKLDVVVIPTNRPIARDDRDDLVYKTRREKFNAIIDEIVALVEAGRPVLVGTTSVEISELLSRMLKLRKIEHNVLNAKLHKREADIVAQAGNAGTVTIATNMAGRGTDIKLSPEVKKAGGLAIVGTERHESRRVDRQLRGRAGRQGDPGSSQFFVSLEDNLMRLFASEKIARLMDRFGQPDGEAIQHGMITNSIERAQRKVEENNFGTRKRLLEYDDVMNSQREVIYKQRRHALYGDRIGVDISNMMYDMAFALATEARKGMDFTEFHFEVFKTLHIETNITETEYPKLSVDALTDRLHHTLIERYMRKTRSMQEESYPVIKRMYDENSTPGRMVYVPFTDGSRKWQIVVDLQKAHDTHCKELTKSFEKASILATIDDSWKEHLRELDDLKQSVQSASYEQKDPLLIYKFESFELFQRMLEHNNKKISSTLIQGHILSNAPAARVQTEYVPPKLDLSKLNLSRADELNSNRQAVTSDRQETKKVETFVRTEKKVGRNEPCPCGSGKKFKQCHGKNQPDI